VFTDIAPNQDPLPPFAVRAPKKPRTIPATLRMGGRRQTMTAREISAFDEMFNMIFNAVSLQKSMTWHDPSSSPQSSDTDSIASVGIGKARIDDLFGKLRRHSKKLKWTSELEQELDRKREQMDLCDTDQQLLDWALSNVFAESKRYELAARRVVEEAALTGVEPTSVPALQPATYPHVIALLMRGFRDKYNDPHLALSIFDHARHLSIASYVFGCSTAAYNELVETRWRCFRDLKGVYDALEEMVVNGVQADSRTLKITESLRREVRSRQLWEVEDEFGSGSGEVHILNKIGQLVASAARRRVSKKSDVPPDVVERRKWSNDQDWKMSVNSQKDPWKFDNWDPPSPRPTSKTRDVLPSTLTR
jgi:hypothetical protein